jgi:hypothetical protein
MAIPIGTRRPIHVAVGCGTKRMVEGTCMNDRLTSAASKMWHRAATLLAERGCKTPGLRKVETCDRSFAAKPAKGRCLDDHLARMGGPGRFATARAVAIQEAVEGASTSNATSPQMQLPRCATILTSNLWKRFDSRSCVSRHVSKRAPSGQIEVSAIWPRGRGQSGHPPAIAERTQFMSARPRSTQNDPSECRGRYSH